MKKIEWVWQGNPGHFICADKCMFRLCTQVGNYLVSTVGEMIDSKKNKMEEIGLHRTYETMVFDNLEKCDTCDCGYYRPISWNEVDFAGYNTSMAAQEGHIKMCKKYEQLQQEK